MQQQAWTYTLDQTCVIALTCVTLNTVSGTLKSGQYL